MAEAAMSIPSNPFVSDYQRILETTEADFLRQPREAAAQ